MVIILLVNQMFVSIHNSASASSIDANQQPELAIKLLNERTNVERNNVFDWPQTTLTSMLLLLETTLIISDLSIRRQVLK